MARFARVVESVLGSYAAGDAAVEEETLGDDVGCVETADAEGYDIVESSRGTKIDQADKTGDAGRDDDSVDWDGTSNLDLSQCDFLAKLD